MLSFHRGSATLLNARVLLLSCCAFPFSYIQPGCRLDHGAEMPSSTSPHVKFPILARTVPRYPDQGWAGHKVRLR